MTDTSNLGNKVEGIVVALYNDLGDNEHLLGWDYSFVIIGNDNRILAEPHNIPPDLEKKVSNVRVWVDVDDNGDPVLDENGHVSVTRKTINIRELLLNFAPSKELKQRMNNGQIKINNTPIKSFDVEVDFDMSCYMELPEFLGDNKVNMDLAIKERQLKINGKSAIELMDFFGSSTLIDGPTNVKRYAFLAGYVMLSITKFDHYVFFNNQEDILPHSVTIKSLPFDYSQIFKNKSSLLSSFSVSL